MKKLNKKTEIIGIICAMEDEAQIIIKKYKLQEIKNKFFKIYSGKVYEKEIFLLVSKIGKVYSASGTTYLIQNFEIDKIINIGLAGGLTKEKEIGKTFQITKVIQHDAFVPWDGEHLNYFQGEIELKKIELNSVKTGICLTGDQFVDDKVECEKLSERGDIVEMEAFAIASVAKIFDKPLLILKSISDNASIDAKGDFYENLKKSMEDGVQVMDKILKDNLF